MYGSDFFFPPIINNDSESNPQQHDYDNLTFTQNSSRQYEPFPILLDCQQCNRTIDRSSFRDISCQVPSDEDEENDQMNPLRDIQYKNHKSKRSSPLYISPRSSPPPCQPPMAINLLAPYHFHRKRSLASYASSHSRSKSAPSASSSTISSNSSRSKNYSETNNKRLQPSLSSIQTVTTMPSLVPETASVSATPSTTALLRSIKTSIHAMKKRLKDIRRLSEVGMCC